MCSVVLQTENSSSRNQFRCNEQQVERHSSLSFSAGEISKMCGETAVQFYTRLTLMYTSHHAGDQLET